MPSRKKIGLALGSGGWRGLAHIGVIKSLIKHGFQVDMIAGSSAGALIGGLYAYFQDIEKVENIFSSLHYKDLLFAFSDPSRKLGLFQGQRSLMLIQKYTGNALIEESAIPFRAVATDLISGEKVVFTSGDLALAIRASSSVPLIFQPMNHKEKLLIDGGLSNPVPVEEVKDMGADITIAVNIYDCIFPIQTPSKKLSAFDVVQLSYQMMLNQLSLRDSKAADIYVAPQLDSTPSDAFVKFVNNAEAIDAGEKVMDEKIEYLTSLL